MVVEVAREEAVEMVGEVEVEGVGEVKFINKLAQTLSLMKVLCDAFY